jgi:transcriptional regulator with XRE-family HTH domain
MSSLYDSVLRIPGGGRALAAARLRSDVLARLREALLRSGLTQTALAERLRIRKSAVNGVLQGDGNLRVNTLAEYLYELGAEVRVEIVPVGTQRREAVERAAQARTAMSAPRLSLVHTYAAEPVRAAPAASVGVTLARAS